MPRWVACSSQASSLKTVMAGYYTYLAAGISKPAKGASAGVHWAEPFEDGQGTGQMTAACARVYDYTKDPWSLFGVVCTGVRSAIPRPPPRPFLFQPSLASLARSKHLQSMSASVCPTHRHH